MRTRLVLAAALLALAAVPARAEGWGLPSETWGIGFGNSRRFTGLRLNLADKDVERITGLNVTLSVPLDGRHYGRPAGTFNGVHVGGLGPLGGDLNGLTLSATITRAVRYDGIVLAPCMINDEGVRGVAAGILLDAYGTDFDGVALAGLVTRADRFRGVAVSGFGNAVELFRGLSVGILNRSDEVRGVQIGLLNVADRLSGLQLGLINHAGNNRPGLRNLPLVNLNLSF